VLSPSTTIEEGAEVLFFVDRRRRWIHRVRRGGVFGSDRGSIPYENVIGRVFGEAVRLSLGFKAYLLRPLLIDYIEKGFERRTQVIYPKDLGFMLILSGIGPGSRVLEAGVGSGVLTAVLANAVRPDGVVVGYELRREFAEVAMENLRRVGLDRFVEIRVRDIREASLNEEFDAAFLDLPDPWTALDVVYRALKPSAPLLVFLPTVNQVEKTYASMRRHGGFVDARCFEILLREYQLVEGALRPETRMVGHTGYILFARKVVRDVREQASSSSSGTA